jgi:hypothetical protein
LIASSGLGTPGLLLLVWSRAHRIGLVGRLVLGWWIVPRRDPLVEHLMRVRSLSPETARRVIELVNGTFGGGWDGFTRYIGEDSSSHEWRFQGERGRLWVSCYREDETPILRAAMAHINSGLEGLLEEEASSHA